MVKELEEAELPVKVYQTDNGLFEIKCKGFTLERFEERLCGEKLKGNPALRMTIVDRWVMFRTRAKDKFYVYKREELIRAWDEFSAYLFKAYMVE